MKQLIDETLVKMNTNEFLSNIKKVFNDLFSSENIDKINLMNYLPEDKWLIIKKNGLLLPFLSEKLGGRKNNQKEIQEVLRISTVYRQKRGGCVPRRVVTQKTSSGLRHFAGCQGHGGHER